MMNELPKSIETQPEQTSDSVVSTVTPSHVVAVPDSKSAKQPETYGQRIKKMSDRQLFSELKRRRENAPGLKINQIFAVVLTEVFESHLKGVHPYPR